LKFAWRSAIGRNRPERFRDETHGGAPLFGATMFSLSEKIKIRPLRFRGADLRAIAEPVAILSPVALIVSAQEAAMTIVALLFALHSWRERDFAWAKQGWIAALLALWAYALLRTLVDHPTATGVLTARNGFTFRSTPRRWRIGSCPTKGRGTDWR
jgi:hypothetical protein